MTRAFAAVVVLTASVASLFGALALWVLRVDAAPGLLGWLVVGAAVALGAGSVKALRASGNGDLIAGLRSAGAEATAFGAALLGGAIALPLVALHGRYVTDSDGQRIIASVDFVSRHGFGYLRRTQDVLLPQVVFRTALAIDGQSGARVVPIAGTVLLAAVVAGLAFVLTRRVVGAVVAAVAIVCMRSVLRSAVELPLYELTLAFGYLGGWTAFRALRAHSTRECARWAVATAVLLALAIEAQGTGLLFLVVPALVFGAFTSAKTVRATSRAVAWVYGAIVLALVPRLLINLSSGGVHHVASTRNEFMVTQGYLRIVNRDFWGWPVDVGFVGYLHRVPGIVRNALGFGAAGLAVLVAASVIGSGWRGRVFVVAALAVFAAALARAEPPPFERYASPLLPGAALLAAVGAVQLLGRSAPLRVVAGAALVALAATGAYELRLTAERERGAQADLLAGPAAQMRPYITDHRGIIGVRASRLVGVDPYLDTWGTSFVTEAEWKTFLLWPSDRAVITVLQRHHIGWVAVIGPRTLESDYNNTWTQPAYGAPVRHRQRLSMSQNFCQRWSSGVYALYELGPCARVASETSG